MSRYNRHTHSGREGESKRDRHRDRHRECGWETIMMCVGERKTESASSTQSAPMSPHATHLVNSSALIVPEESMSYFSSILSSIESIALRPWLLGLPGFIDGTGLSSVWYSTSTNSPILLTTQCEHITQSPLGCSELQKLWSDTYRAPEGSCICGLRAL